MIKLQNNYTTPEQSKRLLELGVPKWTADCYHGWFPEGIQVKPSPFSDPSNPCWSVGRLIEIFSKCYTGAKCYYSPRNLYKTEFWIERFERLSKIGFINFSKLEE